MRQERPLYPLPAVMGSVDLDRQETPYSSSPNAGGCVVLLCPALLPALCLLWYTEQRQQICPLSAAVLHTAAVHRCPLGARLARNVNKHRLDLQFHARHLHGLKVNKLSVISSQKGNLHHAREDCSHCRHISTAGLATDIELLVISLGGIAPEKSIIRLPALLIWYVPQFWNGYQKHTLGIIFLLSFLSDRYYLSGLIPVCTVYATLQ